MLFDHVDKWDSRRSSSSLPFVRFTAYSSASAGAVISPPPRITFDRHLQPIFLKLFSSLANVMIRSKLVFGRPVASITTTFCLQLIRRITSTMKVLEPIHRTGRNGCRRHTGYIFLIDHTYTILIVGNRIHWADLLTRALQMGNRIVWACLGTLSALAAFIWVDVRLGISHADRSQTDRSSGRLLPIHLRQLSVTV